jgi:hypothetical protein
MDKTLWNYIKPYTPYILTAPSRFYPDEQLSSEKNQGKTEWVARLDGMKKLYL